MKTKLVILLLLHSLFCNSQQVDTTLITQDENKYYQISQEGNTKLLIYLHGGVSNTIFDDTSHTPSLDFLLEGNALFLATALENGFNVLAPISNDSMDWLNNYSYCFEKLKPYLELYDSTYLSGFSDGGTGSYKIFYKNSGHFMGLVVFNGFPQHKNFNKKVNYAETTDKTIAFFGTFNDGIIPYEMLLTEYDKQKKYNANTFIYVAAGKHTFAAYDAKAVNICFDILNARIKNTSNEVLHGYVKNDKLLEFYPFRKKILKKYAYGEEYFERNKKQAEKYR